MMEFEKKIKVLGNYGGAVVKLSTWAKGYKLGAELYDIYGQRWEVMEDVHFDKYWFRDVVTEK